MNVSEIERLVELVQQSNISELTLRQEGARITIRKTPPQPEGSALVPYTYGEQPYELDPVDGEISGRSSEPEAAPEPVTIFSPLVGHFRHIKPMIGLGAKVAQGQVVGVIEAVKLINEITSPTVGQVIDVCVDDGQAVEYGQDLFKVMPSN
jgi:acetyl-CoA carboxylase biotin carboxyl carrier protein